MGKVRWKVGTYANHIFSPEREGVVDWGAYYAAKTMLDAEGNRILWGWITETRPDADLIAAGWAGAMSLPRVLSLNSRNELHMEVASEAQRLRAAHTGFAHDESSASREKVLENLRLYDLAAELKLGFRPKTEEFDIRLESERGENFVTISCANKSGGAELRVDNVSAQLSRGSGSPLDLHIFLDGSVLEVFASGTTSLTKRIYRIPSGPLRLKLGRKAELASLDAWKITPISKDRLTGSLCA
jgi:beta-fructofuranosidase